MAERLAPVPISDRQECLKLHRTRIRSTVRRVLAGEGATGGISLVFGDDSWIRAVNRTWLGHDRPTDVIAFPLAGPEDPILGEVVVSAETAVREARARGIPAERELLLYVIHGVLHVLGYRDGDLRSRARMRRREAHYVEGRTRGEEAAGGAKAGPHGRPRGGR